MAARRKAGLDAEAVAALQARLDEGKKPRVALTGPQFPDGAATGTVVRIGSESTDGADFITVRVTVNGVADELAFAPNELELPGRKSTAAPAKATVRRAAAAKAGAVKAPASSGPKSATATMPAPAPVPPAAAPSATAPSAAPPPSAAAPEPRTVAKARTPGPRKKPAAPPKISITVTSSGASWTVSALRGAKSVAKTVAVTPGVVTAVAELLSLPAITDAVAEVNETALAEAEEKAARLRAELAELDAVLAAHRAPR